MAAGKITTAALMIFTAFSASWAATTAIVRSTGDYDPNHCGFWGDSDTLVVTRGNQPPIRKNYCSAYGYGKVRVITDKIGRAYILLEYGEGHGTHVMTTYLKVYTVEGDKLIDLGRELLDEPAGLFVDWAYTYTVALPARGGLQLTFRLHQERPSEPGMLPPPIWEKNVWVNVPP